MLIALLPPRLLRHVEFVMGRERVIPAQNWIELERLLQVRPATVALIDPSADGADRTTEFERIKAAFPSLPIIAYVPLTASAFRAVAQLSRLGLEHVLLYSHDDSAERMRSTIDEVRASPLTARFVREIRPRLERLPVSISNAVEEMFAEPHRYPNAQDIAVSANVSIVRLYRAFQSAEFAAPKKMVMAAKLLRGFLYLSDPGQSVAGASLKLAYRNPRIFAEHTSEVFGFNPSRVKSHLTEAQVVRRLLEWVSIDSPRTSGTHN